MVTLGGAGSAISDTVGTAQQAADDAYRSSLRTILGPLITAMVEVPTFGLGLFDDSPGLHKPTKWPFNQLYPLYVAIQALTGSVLLIAIASGFLKLGYPIQSTTHSESSQSERLAGDERSYMDCT